MSECTHQSTGSHTMPFGWRVLCMNCRAIIGESDAAKRLREACPGWQRIKNGHFCLHCHMDADYHIDVLTARLKVCELNGT